MRKEYFFTRYITRSVCKTALLADLMRPIGSSRAAPTAWPPPRGSLPCPVNAPRRSCILLAFTSSPAASCSVSVSSQAAAAAVCPVLVRLPAQGRKIGDRAVLSPLSHLPGVGPQTPPPSLTSSMVLAVGRNNRQRPTRAFLGGDVARVGRAGVSHGGGLQGKSQAISHGSRFPLLCVRCRDCFPHWGTRPRLFFAVPSDARRCPAVRASTGLREAFASSMEGEGAGVPPVESK